jgi:hypothetical protein
MDETKKEVGREERIARAALMMTGSTPNPREQSVEHFARITDLGTVLAALWILPDVAECMVGERKVDGRDDDWLDADEATAVLTETVAMLAA